MDLSRLPPQVQGVIQKLLQTYPVPLPGGLIFSPNLLQAVLVVFLLFLLVITFAHLRHTYVDWSVKGIMPGLSFGFAIAILLEALLLVGGKTVFTEILGWENAPKPISNVLDSGRDKLVDVLGVSKSIPESKASNVQTANELKTELSSLSDAEQEKFLKLVCNPK